MNKQNLWFLTLFSFIILLGVYYVTMPNQLLEKTEEVIEEKQEETVEFVVEESSLTAMRVSLEEERREQLDVLKEQLVSDHLSSDEKNNLYEQLKYLNEVQGKEEKIEKAIKKEYGLDCFVKIDNNDALAICVANEHTPSLANSIMRMIQKEYSQKMNIQVRFQKK